MRSLTALTLLTVLLSMCGLHAAQGPAPVRRDGEWDVKLEMVVGGQRMETTTHQCITPAQAADPMSILPGGPDAQRGCRMHDYKAVGQTATFRVTCDGPPPITTSGEYLYRGNTYVGTMTMVRGGQTIVTRLTGTRLGDCTNPAAGGRGRP